MSSLSTTSRAMLALVSALIVASPTAMAGRERADPSPSAQIRETFARPADLFAKADDPDHDRVWVLGRRLFFDTRLSASASLSCASCHQPDRAWTDHLPKAVGDAHRPLAFRAPTLLNAGELERYGWTGRFPDVEAVAFFAMTSPANMNISPAVLLSRLSADPGYTAAFHAAFPDGAVSKHNVGLALTRYVRSIASDLSPFDRWIAGDPTAVSASAARGFAVFNGKGRCGECHSGWAFTDGSFHDIGTARGDDRGRGTLFKSSVKLQYAFKTPTLRNAAMRAPYMHDGAITSLEAVIDHYDKGGIDRPSRAEAIMPLHLSADEKQDLLAFLKTLTGGTRFVDRRDD